MLLLPKDSPSAAVFDPPKGKGWSKTSADATSVWNSSPADVRGNIFTCVNMFDTSFHDQASDMSQTKKHEHLQQDVIGCKKMLLPREGDHEPKKHRAIIPWIDRVLRREA